MNKCVYNMLMEPWPEVGVQKPDRGLVRILFEVYAGQGGELTNIVQYFYDSLRAQQAGETEISDLFACVSQTEMLHLRKLGQLILQFGGDPRLLSYRGNRAFWWSSGYVNYGGDLRAMLRRAIAGERQAVQTYQQIAGRMEGAPKALMERIVQDEVHHIELFQRTLSELE